MVRHVIFDRDGVLNHAGDDLPYVREPADFRWLPGALEGLALLRSAGVTLSVATNQSAVGRGLMSVAQLSAVHARMTAEAFASGAALDALFCCTHAPDAGCDCRKPAPGLIRQAIAHSGVPAAESIVVGDDVRDIEAAQRAGVPAALVRTGKGRRTEALLSDTSLTVYDDLSQLARALLEARPVAAP